jgi:putative copper export protein
VTVWLNLALGLVQVIGFVMTKLDEAQKRKVWEEAMKTKLGAIADVQISQAVLARLSVDTSPERLRAPDSDSRS